MAGKAQAAREYLTTYGRAVGGAGRRGQAAMKEACGVGRRGRGWKAQAAMEYLTTYGCALVVIVIVLAAFVWLGVFRGRETLPEQCEVGNGIFCPSWKATPAAVQLTIKNARAVDIYVCDVICDSRKTDGTTGLPQGVAQIQNCGGTGKHVKSGGEAVVSSLDGSAGAAFCTDDGSTPVGVGSRYSGPVYMAYSEPGAGTAGSARVQKGMLIAGVNPA